MGNGACKTQSLLPQETLVAQSLIFLTLCRKHYVVSKDDDDDNVSSYHLLCAEHCGRHF